MILVAIRKIRRNDAGLVLAVFFSCWLAILIELISPDWARGEDGKALSLKDCLRIALETSPVPQGAEKAVLASKAAAAEALAPYYPDLGLQGRYAYWQQRAFLPGGLSLPGRPLPKTIGPTEDWLAGLRARYTLFDSGERRALYQTALARQGALEEERIRATQDLVLSVHQGFYGLTSALETRRVAEKNLLRAEDHLRLAKERKAAGAVPLADVLRAQVERANAELALVRAENLVRVSRGGLNTVMGRPVGQSLEIEPGGEEISSPDSIDLPLALDQAAHQRPEIRAALKRIVAGQAAVAAVKSSFGPKVRVEGSYGFRDTVFLPRDEEWLAGISIEWPLFTGFSRQHRLARAKAEVSREEAEAKQLLLKVKQEVWTAHSRLKEAYQALQSTKVVVREAEEGLRLIKERYEAGAGTINDLLDAQTALVRAQANQIEAGWDYQTARAVFRRSLGE